jgi:branched-chain amino acid transport system substrate-binding protein
MISRNLLARHNIMFTVALIAILILSSSNCRNHKRDGINIGSILSLTGSAAQYGQWSKNGIELAVSEVNDSGGVNGQPLSIIYEDDASVPTSAVAAAQKLINVDHVQTIIGPLTSSNVLAIAPIAENSQVVLLSPCASSPKITNAGDFIFRNWPSDDFEGSAMADFLAKELHLNNFAVLAMNNEYGIGVRDVFIRRAGENGLQMLGSFTFEQDGTDFRTQLARVAELHPQAVYVPGHAKEVARILRQARELGIRSVFASSVAFESPDVFSIAGNAAEGVYYTAPSFDPNSDNETVRRFQEAYQSRFREKAEVFAAHAYDAILILATSLRTASNNPIKLKETLYSLKDFNGVTGSTTFDKNGDVIKPITIKVVQNKSFQVWHP